MKILFFSLLPIYSLKNKGIYADMISEFYNQGDSVDYFFPSEKFYFKNEGTCTFNSIKTDINPQKQSNFIIKFIIYLYLELKFSNIIKRKKNNYDALILTTPSIFQLKIIRSFKKKNKNSKIFLLLKDIFPDNAINLGVLSNSFPLNILVYIFNLLEKKLFNNVDFIGCMSTLNIDFISRKYPTFKNKLFLSPNSQKPYKIQKLKSRKDLNLPEDKKICIFIGNIGLPQDPQLISSFIKNAPSNFYIILIGNGAKFSFNYHSNLLVINKFISQDEIDQYLINSDYGLIFLSYKFKVPNFPSKLLSYFNANIDVIAFTNFYNDLNPYFKQSFPTTVFWNNSEKIFYENLFLFPSLKSNQKDQFLVKNQITTIKSIFKHLSI